MEITKIKTSHAELVFNKVIECMTFSKDKKIKEISKNEKCLRMVRE